MKHVVLVGLMGSGKSTIGQIVADRTGRSLVDVAIAARTGQTVRQLWEEGGDAPHRHLESEEVLQTLRAGPCGQVAHAVADADGVAPEAAADIVVNMVAGCTTDG